MHGEIDRAGDERLLDLLGEQPLAAGFRQRAVLNGVPGGADDRDCDALRIDIRSRGEPASHLVRLRERQRRAARTDA